MRDFYEQSDESFGRRTRRRYKFVRGIILSYLIILFVISLLPLLYQLYTTQIFSIFKPVYFLDTNSPLGIGAYIFKNDPYLPFLSDIFFGGFKPLIYISHNDTVVKTLEFSDSSSNVDSANLFSDLDSTLTVGKNTFTQKYYENDTLILEKNVSIVENRINFNFTLDDSVDTFNLVFYTSDNLSLNGNIATVRKNVCDVSFRIFSSNANIRTTANTLELYDGDKHSVTFELEFLDETCSEKEFSEVPPLAMFFGWIYLLYPLVTLLLIGIFWRLYGRK